MAVVGMEYALHPVLFFSRVFGVGPVTPRLHHTTLYSLYILIVFALLIYCTLYSLVFLYGMDEALYANSLRLSLDRFQFLLNSFTASFSIVCTFVTGEQTMQVLKDLETIDDFFQKNGSQISYDRKRYFTGSLLRLILVSIGITLEHFFVTNIDSLKRLIFFICQFLPMFIAHFIEYQHNAILDTIQSRFDCLKEKLMKIKTIQSSLNTQTELESLVKIYNHLVENCNVINEIYGKQVLLIVGNIFLLTIANADYVVEGLIKLVLNRSSSQIEELLTFGYWAALRLVELWSVVKTCEAVVFKAKDFSNALYQYMIEESAETCKNKKIRLHLTVQKVPYFSAHGFFALDFTLIHSIIAAATTYLVILIQFSQNTTNKTSKLAVYNKSSNKGPTINLFEDIDYSNNTI